MGILDKVDDFIDQIQTTEQYTNDTLKNDGGKGLKNKKSKDPKTPKSPRLEEPKTETPQGERARIRKKLNDSFIAMSKEVRRTKGKGGR